MSKKEKLDQLTPEELETVLLKYSKDMRKSLMIMVISFKDPLTNSIQ